MFCILEHFPLLYFHAVHKVSFFYADITHIKNASLLLFLTVYYDYGAHVAGTQISWKNTLDF